MIASRETMNISRSLRKKDKSATTISLSDSNEGLSVTRSIASFVDSKLSNLPDHFDQLQPDASTMDHVRQTLLKKSHGKPQSAYQLASHSLKLKQACSSG
jgi:hypothetical protein